jgi:hypothetical protein
LGIGNEDFEINNGDSEIDKEDFGIGNEAA